MTVVRDRPVALEGAAELDAVVEDAVVEDAAAVAVVGGTLAQQPCSLILTFLR